jgi:hypothetical protein
MAGGCYVEVFAQIGGDRLLLLAAHFRARMTQPMLDARQKEGESLSQVAENDLEPRKAVEQPAQDQTQRATKS